MSCRIGKIIDSLLSQSPVQSKESKTWKTWSPMCHSVPKKLPRCSRWSNIFEELWSTCNRNKKPCCPKLRYILAVSNFHKFKSTGGRWLNELFQQWLFLLALKLLDYVSVIVNSCGSMEFPVKRSPHVIWYLCETCKKVFVWIILFFLVWDTKPENLVDYYHLCFDYDHLTCL